MEPETDFSIGHERMFDKQNYSDSGWSYFKQKPVILTFGLLALSYILVIVLFINVLSQNSTIDMSILASKSDILSLNTSVDELTTKLKQVEQDAKKATSCDPNWEHFECSCYYFSSMKSDWMKARALCIGKSSDLVVITSEKEQKFLSAKTKNSPYWIGLSDIKEEGKFNWVDGTEYTSSYKSWMKDEPNDQGKKEDCAHMWMNGDWNDKICSHDQNFAICEKKF
ncbi:hepatic lectin-like [Mixophyes fleayi]|uniref:hepatic lectin-like n=1 Tax=Mixophyes fleayi TaxID=3061075 RepID=UPI003F4DE442